MPLAISCIDVVVTDTNSIVAGWLRDLAFAQPSIPSRWGYKRAAAAVLNLEEPIERLLRSDGTLSKIPNVGPASTRVILEVLQLGTSSIVERAIDASDARADILRRRGLRRRGRSGLLRGHREAEEIHDGREGDAAKGE